MSWREVREWIWRARGLWKPCLIGCMGCSAPSFAMTKLFKSAGQAQRFLSAHDGISNLFHLRRQQVPATQYRAARTHAFQVWAEVTGVAAAA